MISGGLLRRKNRVLPSRNSSGSSLMKMGAKSKTIEEVVKNGLCTGCATCVSLCPRSAIELMKDDSKGIYLPRLNGGECNQCGICLDVCPGHSVDFKDLNLAIFGQESKDSLLGNYLNCYIAHTTDYDIRYNSSSGGLVTALLIFALEEGIIDGALVTRMKKGKPLEPEPFIAKTKQEIIEAARSKYCPVPANMAVREILEREGKYAVVGLPCHLHGIRKAEIVNSRLREKIVLHVGIFCSGVPNFRATEFLLHRLKVKSEEVKTLEYRGEGWPGMMSLRLKGGETKLIPYPTYWEGFGELFFPLRCAICVDWLSKLADISFGDSWLPEIKKDDKIGTSVIISRSMQGEDILHQMMREGKIELSVISSDKVKESQGGFPQRRKDFKARLAISKLFNRRVPIPDDGLALQPSPRTYIRSGLLYLLSLLASRRCLWWLVDIYCSLFRQGRYIKSRLGL